MAHGLLRQVQHQPDLLLVLFLEKMQLDQVPLDRWNSREQAAHALQPLDRRVIRRADKVDPRSERYCVRIDVGQA